MKIVLVVLCSLILVVTAIDLTKKVCFDPGLNLRWSPCGELAGQSTGVEKNMNVMSVKTATCYGRSWTWVLVTVPGGGQVWAAVETGLVNNCGGGGGDTTVLSEYDVCQKLKTAGFPNNDLGKMVCTCNHESGRNPGATNRNTNGSTDYGLFQINNYYWCGESGPGGNCHVACNDLLNADVNTRCANVVYRQQGITAWYGYQNYRAECDAYPSPC